MNDDEQQQFEGRVSAAAAQLAADLTDYEALVSGLPVARARLRADVLERIGEPLAGDPFVLTYELALAVETTHVPGPRSSTPGGSSPLGEAATVGLGSRSFAEHHGRAITMLRAGVPNRNVTTVAGDGGLGKSLLVLSWAAELAKADGEALIVVAEDGEDVAKLRLRALDAPLDKLHFLTVEWGLDERGDPDYDAGAISLPEQATRLDEIVASFEGRLQLLVIDPWAECLDVSVDSHQAQSLRRAIAALRRIAARRDLATVVVAHLNKSGHTSLRKRVDGSGALYDGSRSVFLLAPDPDADAKRVLAHGKFNVGELLPSRELEVKPTLVLEAAGEPPGDSATIVATGVTKLTHRRGAARRDQA